MFLIRELFNSPDQYRRASAWRREDEVGGVYFAPSGSLMQESGGAPLPAGKAANSRLKLVLT
jgi:hypothetical protein